MLSRNVVESIKRLLEEGQLTRRKIAEQVGASRTTVDAIARGSRGLYGQERIPESDDGDAIQLSERCPKCGFRVHLPCLVCRTREYREQKKCMRKFDGEVAASRRRRSVKRDRGRPRRARVA